MIGNAVPVPLAYEIAVAIKDALLKATKWRKKATTMAAPLNLRV